MRKLLLSLLSVSLASSVFADEQTPATLTLFDHAVFYDGYLMDKNPDKNLDDGILRHSTSLYAVKLTDEQIAQIGESLSMNVFVTACCDNYDRIGNINLAFVDKGSESYSKDEVQRIEIGRFITPFMNKNLEPSTVPYTYYIDFVSPILRDATILEKYDIWVEFELFGIPYDAQEKIRGCAGRTDVFQGTLEFKTTTPASELTNNNVLVPIVIKNPEYIQKNLNNYNEEATDELGKTIKTYKFTVPEDVEDGQIVLITSNHGANANGEEYNRRMHYVSYDGEEVLVYKPGRTSCEPFRVYNTQGNGIYGRSKKSDRQWQSFSNWCPGDVIDNRIINLGPVTKGEHSITINVPDAKFADGQGDIPVSMFFQGAKKGQVPTADIDPIFNDWPEVMVSHDGKMLTVSSEAEIAAIEIYDLAGTLVYRQHDYTPINTDNLVSNIYFVSVELADGRTITRKMALSTGSGK